MQKNSSICSAVSIELRLVTDAETAGHRVIASTRASIASTTIIFIAHAEIVIVNGVVS